MSKRGLGLAGEFRYLEPKYSGELTLEAMPGTSCATGTAGAIPGSTASPSIPRSAAWV
jgi:lipopolysaccharide assembly outer membrane protein LptD (OstA)